MPWITCARQQRRAETRPESHCRELLRLISDYVTLNKILKESTVSLFSFPCTLKKSQRNPTPTDRDTRKSEVSKQAQDQAPHMGGRCQFEVCPGGGGTELALRQGKCGSV